MIARLKIWALAAVALLGALRAAFLKGRSAGKAEEKGKTAARRDALQEDYDEIDRAVPDPDGAYKRLRDRSR